MTTRIRAVVSCLGLAFAAPVLAQPAPGAREAQLPEEVVIIGNRRLLDLRTQMMEAEKEAYDVFNELNDEPRFDIHCSMHQPTGTRLKRQVCTPNFQTEANAEHARVYWESLRDHLDLYTQEGTTQSVFTSVETRIASQQADFKQKLRQVAQEQPRFLDSLIRYSELRNSYEEAVSSSFSGEP